MERDSLFARQSRILGFEEGQLPGDAEEKDAIERLALPKLAWEKETLTN